MGLPTVRLGPILSVFEIVSSPTFARISAELSSSLMAGTKSVVCVDCSTLFVLRGEFPATCRMFNFSRASASFASSARVFAFSVSS